MSYGAGIFLICVAFALVLGGLILLLDKLVGKRDEDVDNDSREN